MASTDVQALVNTLTGIAPQILGTKYAFIALYAATLYDYCLTFSDEVKYIWSRKFSFVTFMFIMNRYFSLGVFTVSLAAFFSPLFTPEVCNRFALFYPFSLGVPLIVMPGMVMALRVVALYGRNKWVALFLISYVMTEFIVAIWVYSYPGSHPLPVPDIVADQEPFHLCIDLTADVLGNARSATYQFMETIYDTILFGLLIFKTIQVVRVSNNKNLVTVLVRHGVIYFGVVTCANVLWAMMVIFAPAGLKYSTAIPTAMLVCIMVNRMTINLRADSSPSGLTTRDTNIVDWTVQRHTLRFRPARSLLPWETLATDDGNIYSTVAVETPTFSLSSPDQSQLETPGETIELHSVSESTKFDSKKGEV